MSLWRSFFLAIGIFSMIFGAECLGVDKITLRFQEPPPPRTGFTAAISTPPPPQSKEVLPAPWWPWSFLSFGAVTCIYCFTIPKRMAGP